MADPNKPENELKNTIDVQLRLIESSEIDSLRKIFADFKGSVKSFESALGSWQTQLNAATSQLNTKGRGPKTSPYIASAQQTSSVADDTPQTIPSPSDQAAAAGENLKKLGSIRQRAMSNFHQTAYEALDKNGPSLGDIFIAGEIGKWGTRQILQTGVGVLGRAYYGGDGYGPQNPQRPWLKMPFYGATAAAAGYASSSGITNMMASLGAPTATQFGSGVGYARNDAFLPFLSSAAKYYYGSTFDSMKRSWFGLNPFYSFGQAQDAKNIINQLGYKTGTRDQMANVLADVTSSMNGLSQTTQAQFLDTGYRYGTASISELHNAIVSLGQAAQASQMNVQTYADQLIAAGRSIGSSQGIPAYMAMQQIQGIAQGTGLSPELASGVLGSDFITSVTAAQMGGNFWRATNTPLRAGFAMRNVTDMITQVAGVGSWSQLQALEKSRGPRWSQAMNKIYLAWKASPQLFGNLNPTLIASMLGRGINPASMAMAGSEINYARSQNLTHGTGRYSIHTIMNDLGITADRQAAFLQHNAGMSYQDQLKKLQTTFNNEQAKALQGQHSRQVMLGLTPGAARLVKLLPPNNPSTSNQNDNSQSAVSANYGNIAVVLR